MGHTILGTSVKEKDLGVTLRLAAAKGNQILGLIRRNITYMEKTLIIPLYKAIVRPHLEYCIQVRRPYQNIKHLYYERRLLECRLTTLETRRLRGDIIEVFKILNGYEDIDSNFFSN